MYWLSGGVVDFLPLKIQLLVTSLSRDSFPPLSGSGVSETKTRIINNHNTSTYVSIPSTSSMNRSASSQASSASPSTSKAPSMTSTSSPAPSTMSSSAAEEAPSDGSKLKTFIGILRKFIGVADIATVRFSLPAQLLEPTPNLEYWNYLDRPDAFIAMGESDDELERMLSVMRFWFTKDLKYIRGKPCKPYNSTLGEFFRCNWEVEDAQPAISAVRDAGTISSASSFKSSKSTAVPSITKHEASFPPVVQQEKDHKVRVSYLTEQTSHHPPVSAFFIDCPEKGITARGFDQISAKFTGTSIKVGPGEHNLGIFINLEMRDNEQYQLTHPAAHLGGLLRGALSVTVGDQCFITCKKTKLKVILEYKEEGWLGKTQNKVEGVIFRYDPEDDIKTRIKDVPEKEIIGRVGGNWREKIFFSLGTKPVPQDQQILLLDLTSLTVIPKITPPSTSQLPNESRRFWAGVTEAINSRQYSRATALKQELEEAQRVKAREREEKEEEWRPRFFTESLKGEVRGKPDLTEEGRMALKALSEGNWDLKLGGGELKGGGV